jgi:hypothetical protein
MHQNLFLGIVILFVIALVGTTTHYLLRSRRIAETSWATLLGRLTKVNNGNIAVVALDLVDDSGRPRQTTQAELEADQIWELLGGMKGLEALGANCDVLIDLAAHIQLWYPEALVVAEQMRLNAREIKWHIERLQGAAQTGNLESSFPAYAQRAAALYYLMTRHLLSLYELANAPELAQLQAAL